MAHIFITTHNHGAGAKESPDNVGIDTTFYVVAYPAFASRRLWASVYVCPRGLSTRKTRRGLISVAETILVTHI